MKTLKVFRLALFSLMFSALSMQVQASCAPTTHATNISELSGLLPGDARGALAVDISGTLSGSSAAQVADLLNGDGSDAALNEPFSAIGTLAANIDLAAVLDTALLAQTTNASDGLFLLAKLSCDTIGEVTTGAAPTANGTYGTGAHAMYLDVNGNSLSLLPGGVLVVGKQAAVESVIDVADSTSAANASDIAPFISALQTGSPLTFVYGLPAMFNNAITADRSLRGAELVSGSINFAAGNISGNASFHTSNAASFADNYNTLDAISGEAPLLAVAPIANGLPAVQVTIPSTPIDKSAAQLITSRNTLRKLSVGMEAFDYAEDINDPGNAAWLDLEVSSFADGENSPGSVFIRWPFKDQAAITSFEQNFLPAGFTLAPTQFYESDPEAGIIFVTVNLYNSAGGLVEDARAEFDVFVYPADPLEKQYDPNGKERPRFMVFSALAAAVSAEPAHGLTAGEPLTHEFVGNQVVDSVAKMVDDGNGGLIEMPVFGSSFILPANPEVPAGQNIARFTREMAIGNDYIYWEHSIYDRVLYNATTFNWDAHFIPLQDLTITTPLDTPWAHLVDLDNPIDVSYYINTLEYVVSPWQNLNSPNLDITPEWRQELLDFKNNGNYLTLGRTGVRKYFKGQDETLLKYNLQNSTPSVYYNFPITNPGAMEAAIGLPPGHTLAQTTLFKDDVSADYYLTLAVFDIEDAVEGTRAEWRVYVDNGNGRPRTMIIDLQTEDAALNPVSMINLPSEVAHSLGGTTLSTSLSSMSIDFDASIDMQGTTDDLPSLDWLETIDFVCYLNGICDKQFYDAGTIDELMHQASTVTVNTVSTPWNAHINTTPSSVFYRDNLQEVVYKPWENAATYLEDPPFVGPTITGSHTITGTGTLIGDTNPAVNSTYDYYGGATISFNTLEYILYQEISNPIGKADMITEAYFDLTTGVGESTVIACIGAPLICAGADPVIGTPAATSELIATNINDSNPNSISWDVNFPVDVQAFGTAVSDSTFVAILGEPLEQPPVDPPVTLCGYNPNAGFDWLLMVLLACCIFYARNFRFRMHSHS